MSVDAGQAYFLNAYSNNPGMHYQRGAQEDAQIFNAEEAEKARYWQSVEAATARQWQSDEAAIARDFALSYDNTKYQRAVNDMKAAGYNPAMLSGTLGTNSPVASSATSVGASTGNNAHSSITNLHGGIFGNVVSSALNAALTKSLTDKKVKESVLSRTSQEISKAVNDMESDDLTPYQRQLLEKHGRLDEYEYYRALNYKNRMNTHNTAKDRY